MPADDRESFRISPQPPRRPSNQPITSRCKCVQGPSLFRTHPVFSLPPGRVQCPRTRTDPPLGAVVTTQMPPSVPRAPLAAADPGCSSSGNRAAHTHRPAVPSSALTRLPCCSSRCTFRAILWAEVCACPVERHLQKAGPLLPHVCASSQSHIQDLEHSTTATLLT